MNARFGLCFSVFRLSGRQQRYFDIVSPLKRDFEDIDSYLSRAMYFDFAFAEII